MNALLWGGGWGNVGVSAEALSLLVVDQLFLPLSYPMMTFPRLWTLQMNGLQFELGSAIVMCSQARF